MDLEVKRKGWIEVIAGPMFAGKSEELLRRIRRLDYARQKYVVFKPAIDTRYSKGELVSHIKNKSKAIPIKKANEIYKHISYNTDVVIVDEAQFLDINKEEIRAKLKQLGSTVIMPETLMKRVVFYTGENSFARVRDEGGKIVMTYKNVSDRNSILGTKEVNLVVNSYDGAILFLQGCGLRIKSKQDSYREMWKYNDAEICIDTWPWIPTFVEIEGPSEESVWNAAEKLGFSKKQAKFGSVDTTYQHYYGIDTDVVNLHTPEITFDIEPPKWVKK